MSPGPKAWRTNLHLNIYLFIYLIYSYSFSRVFLPDTPPLLTFTTQNGHIFDTFFQ